MAEPTLNPNASFVGPIPGASLTTEPGNRPWETPPKETDLETVIDNYLRRLSQDELIRPVLDAIKYGSSITTMVESIIEVAVMEGEHSIDIGILASPVIVEYFKQACEAGGIKYKLSDEDIREGRKIPKIDNRLVEEVLQEMEEKQSKPIDTEIKQEVKKEKSTKGLMSRDKEED